MKALHTNFADMYKRMLKTQADGTINNYNGLGFIPTHNFKSLMKLQRFRHVTIYENAQKSTIKSENLT